MKLPSAKTIVWAILLATAFKAGPGGIQTVYTAVTPKAEFDAHQEEYEHLVSTARTLEPEERAAHLERRRYLVLWFRARGLNVDDRPDSDSIWQPWSDLIDYWTESPSE